MADTPVATAATADTASTAPATPAAAPAAATTTAASTAPVAAAPAATTTATADATAATVATTDPAATDKPKDAAPAGAPEQYEFKATEGDVFNPNVIKAYSEVAKELNMTQEAAQKVIDKVGPVMRQQQVDLLRTTHKEWVEAAETDAEFGGAKFAANGAMAVRAINAFGSPALKQLLNATGLGDHPEFIRFAYRAAKAISPDKLVTGGKPADDGKELTYAERLYGKK
jgi:hypothetical protein